MGVENGMFRSEIGSGFEDPGGTLPPRIPRITPPGDFYRYIWSNGNTWPLSSWRIFIMAVRKNNDSEGWHHAAPYQKETMAMVWQSLDHTWPYVGMA